MKTVPCPHCGEPILPTARSCWSCGSDEKTGWSDDQYMDGIETRADFDYEESLAREFGEGPKREKSWYLRWQAVVGAVLLVLFILGVVQSLM